MPTSPLASSAVFPQEITSILVATALADAHGLVAEGLSPRRLRRWYPEGLPVFGVLPGHGLVSDDTEHAAITAQCLALSAGDAAVFEKQLSRRLRRWLWALPPATGLATGRALLKLSIGVSPQKSGTHSAGNGACMRAPILGLLVTSPGGLYDLVRRSSRMTHRDERAISGAFIVARWVQLAVKLRRAPSLEELEKGVLPWIEHDKAWPAVFRLLATSLEEGQTTQAFVASQGWSNGPTGFVMHTVPAALHTLYSVEGSWEEAVRSAVRLGGDADSVGALVGAMAHVDPRRGPLPTQWLERLCDRPVSASWLQKVEAAARKAMFEGHPVLPPSLPFLPMMGRNLGFFGLVLVQGIRRLFPPY